MKVVRTVESGKTPRRIREASTSLKRLSSQLQSGNSAESAWQNKRERDPLTFSEHDGVLYLHFGTEWVQGAMSICKPDWLELEYARYMMAWMLFKPKVQRIAQFGLGSGSLTKYCYRQFPEVRVTAVELNPEVVEVCRVMFKLPRNDSRLTVLEMDALDFVAARDNHGRFDVIQADLFDAKVEGPVLDSAEFYGHCSNCLTQDGIMAVNLFAAKPGYEKSVNVLRQTFTGVICLPPIVAGNVVALCFNTRPTLDFDALYARARLISYATGLPAKSWVDGLNFWQLVQEKPLRKEPS